MYPTAALWSQFEHIYIYTVAVLLKNITLRTKMQIVCTLFYVTPPRAPVGMCATDFVFVIFLRA